jgi:uncharacterized metal-binding protein YceD (DUF177 family)
MQDRFKIFVDRLKDGSELVIKETVSSDFLDIQETELSFSPQVSFKGKSYLADDHLVVNLNVNATAILPCKICNEPVQVEILLSELTFTLSVNEIASSVFDFSSLLREAILLEVPPFAECQKGSCPERENVKKYFKQNNQKGKQNDHFFPFSSLES